MSKAVNQVTRPAITGSAVFADARQEARPMRRTAANNQERHEQDTLGGQHGGAFPTVSPRRERSRHRNAADSCFWCSAPVVAIPLHDKLVGCGSISR